MPFLVSGFSPAGANSKPGASPQMHSYRTTDALATVDTLNYFLPVASLLYPGDLIWAVVVDSNGAVTAAGWLMVNERTATTVDTTNASAFTLTDSR